MVRIRLAVAAGLALFTVVGCSAGTENFPIPSPSSTAAFTYPAGTRNLASFGFAHGPREFYVPTDVSLVRGIDQTNVVTLVVSQPDAETMAKFLVDNVESMGFELVSHTADTVVFKNDAWDGAFAAGGGIAGLTLRNLDPSVGPK